jgi:TusA-related sulfurtransferase
MSTEPTFVRDDRGRVGFLDAPGAEPADLLPAITGALAELPPGAILTVYADPAGAPAISELCEEQEVDLIAVIPDGDRGATFTLSKSGPAPA